MQSGDPLVNATLAGLKMIDKAISEHLTMPIVPKSAQMTPRDCVLDGSDCGHQGCPEAVQDLDTTTVTDAQIAKYVAHGGIHCPACLSGDIVGDSFDVNEGYCTQEMSCSECGATWTDEYELTGVTDFKVGVESTEGGQTIEPSKS